MVQHAMLLGYIYIVHKSVFQKLKVLTQRKEVNERNSNRYEGESEDTVAGGCSSLTTKIPCLDKVDRCLLQHLMELAPKMGFYL